MKPLRPRARLARRFVDWYTAEIGQASRPIARMKLLFALLTASFLAHLLVVCGECDLGASPLRVSVSFVKKPFAPEKKPRAKKLRERKVDATDRIVLLTDDQKKNAQKNAKKVGGHNDNKVGGPEKPAVAKPQDKAALERKSDTFVAKPARDPKATTPAPAVAMATSDAKKEDGKPVDPKVDLGPTKKRNPGESKEDRDGQRGEKRPEIAGKGRSKIVAENLHRMNDWTRYELEGGRSSKDATPGIFIGNSSAVEWTEIIEHFDLCPIAYPDTKDYFVLVDMAAPMTFTKAQGEPALNALKARYASSGIAFSKRKLWSTSVFSGVAEKVCEQFGIPKSQVNVMILAPRQVMSYLAWKAASTVKDQGFAPAKVRACHARFTRTADGGWILEVTDVVLDDGSIHKVRA